MGRIVPQSETISGNVDEKGWMKNIERGQKELSKRPARTSRGSRQPRSICPFTTLATQMPVHRILSERLLVRSVIAREVAGRKMSFSHCFRVTVKWPMERNVQRLLKSFFTVSLLLPVHLDEKNLVLRFSFFFFLRKIYRYLRIICNKLR